MCLPKKLGGLGVKNLEFFNLSLLPKWRWRLLVDKGAVWFNLLAFKYEMEFSAFDQVISSSHNSSFWWKDLFLIEGRNGNHNPWFSEAVGRKLGNGSQVSFWNEKWVGTNCLKDIFPRLFQLAVHKDAKVAEMGAWENQHWVWKWIYALFLNGSRISLTIYRVALIMSFCRKMNQIHGLGNRMPHYLFQLDLRTKFCRSLMLHFL